MCSVAHLFCIIHSVLFTVYSVIFALHCILHPLITFSVSYIVFNTPRNCFTPSLFPLFFYFTSLHRVEYTTTQTPQERASSVDLISPSAFVVANIAPQSYQVRTESLPCLDMNTYCSMCMMRDASARLWRVVARSYSMHIIDIFMS